MPGVAPEFIRWLPIARLPPTLEVIGLHRKKGYRSTVEDYGQSCFRNKRANAVIRNIGPIASLIFGSAKPKIVSVVITDYTAYGWDSTIK